MKNVDEAVPADWDDYVTEMRNRMEQAVKAVRDQLGQALQRAKQAYDGRDKKLQFKGNDLVWFFCPRKRPRLGPRWQLLTTGPWQIENALNSVNYVIRRMGGRNRRVIHVYRLQRYDEEAREGVVQGSKPRPDGDNLTSRWRPDADNLTRRPMESGDNSANAAEIQIDGQSDQTGDLECGNWTSQSTDGRRHHLNLLCGVTVHQDADVRLHNGGLRRQPPTGRSLPPGVQTADPVSGVDTIASMSDPEVISDDDDGWGDDPAD